jgi:hypothetical protein
MLDEPHVKTQKFENFSSSDHIDCINIECGTLLDQFMGMFILYYYNLSGSYKLKQIISMFEFPGFL